MFKRIDHVEIVTDQPDKTVSVLHRNPRLHGQQRTASSAPVSACRSTSSISISAAPSSADHL